MLKGFISTTSKKRRDAKGNRTMKSPIFFPRPPRPYSIFITVLTFLAFLTASHNVNAAVKLPSLFGDHMVIQQGVEVPIWGWADPGEEVHVSIKPDDRNLSTTSIIVYPGTAGT